MADDFKRVEPHACPMSRFEVTGDTIPLDGRRSYFSETVTRRG
ncbi:hypothetical protein OIE52_03160 [Streptomyces canus]|nr:hypothetical protein [Streptomyces canus]